MLLSDTRVRAHPPENIIGHMKIQPDDVVVDLGCGPGYYTLPIAKHAKQVFAIDLQQEMLDMAKKRAMENGVKIDFMRSDGTIIDLASESVDKVLVSGVLHEFPDAGKVLAEIRRILKPSGTLTIRERTRVGLTPVGPPIMRVREIDAVLDQNGFQISSTTREKRDSFVTAVKQP